MVGVVGKSKACHDCRRRRVKCDLRRPTCLRCDKAKIACQGYERTTIFVNRTLADPKTSAQRAISEFKTQALTSSQVKPVSYWQQTLKQLSSEGFNTTTSRVQFRMDAWILLKELYLPKPSPVNKIDIGVYNHYSWVQTACFLKGESNALDYSLAAFCAIQLQIIEAGSTKTEIGHALYIYSLQELVKELAQEQERVTDEALAAIVVVSTCELFSNSNSDGWSAHVHGISEILKQHKSSEDVSPTWRSLCSRLRIVSILLGLTKNQALAFEADRWRRFTGGYIRTETSFEGLMDILSDMPQLLQEAAAALVNSTEVRKMELGQSLWIGARKICSWRRKFKASSLKPIYWPVPSEMHNPADDSFADRLFPFALEYESLDAAVPMILSAGVVLQILLTILNLDPNLYLDQPSWDHEELDQEFGPGPLVVVLAEAMARFLCQSLEYCHRREMGSLGPQCTWHTQWSLGQYFQQPGRERELEWVNRIKEMSGPHIQPGMIMMAVTED